MGSLQAGRLLSGSLWTGQKRLPRRPQWSLRGMNSRRMDERLKACLFWQVALLRKRLELTMMYNDDKSIAAVVKSTAPTSLISK